MTNQTSRHPATVRESKFVELVAIFRGRGYGLQFREGAPSVKVVIQPLVPNPCGLYKETNEGGDSTIDRIAAAVELAVEAVSEAGAEMEAVDQTAIITENEVMSVNA